MHLSNILYPIVKMLKFSSVLLWNLKMFYLCNGSCERAHFTKYLYPAYCFFVQFVMIAICLLGNAIDQVSQHLFAVRQKTRQASEILTLLSAMLVYFIKIGIFKLLTKCLSILLTHHFR